MTPTQSSRDRSPPRLVLLVVREQDERARLTGWLQRHGVRALAVEYVLDALGWLDDAAVLPSLILFATDSAGSGRRFLLRRLHAGWRHVPVLLVTDVPELLAQVADLDVAAVAAMPLDEARLIEQVESVLRSRAPPAC